VRDRLGLGARIRRLLAEVRNLVEDVVEGGARVPSLLSIVLTDRRGVVRAEWRA